MVGKHRGDDFLQGQSLCLPLGWTPFHMLSWSGNNTRALCCISRSRRLYSQPNCTLYCSLYCCLLLSVLFPLPFSHSLHVCMLPHSHLPTHILRTLRTHTLHAPPYSWKGLPHSYNNGNCRCRRTIDSTWTPSSFTEVACAEVFGISNEL